MNIIILKQLGGTGILLDDIVRLGIVESTNGHGSHRVRFNDGSYNYVNYRVYGDFYVLMDSLSDYL